jgi:hypothetical protein
VPMAGDHIFVPEVRPKEEASEITKVHTFRLKGVPARLNFRLKEALGNQNGVNVLQLAGVKVFLRRCFTDPEDTKRFFPPELPVRVEFGGGAARPGRPIARWASMAGPRFWLATRLPKPGADSRWCFQPPRPVRATASMRPAAPLPRLRVRHPPYHGIPMR